MHEFCDSAAKYKRKQIHSINPNIYRYTEHMNDFTIMSLLYFSSRNPPENLAVILDATVYLKLLHFCLQSQFLKAIHSLENMF